MPKLSIPTRTLAIVVVVLCSGSLDRAQFIERPLISGREAVVTSLEPLASMAGMRILLEGGNAFNAAIATALAVGVVDSTQARAARCEDLAKLNLPDVTITSSTSVPAGQFTPPGSSTALETPEFCRVVAVAKPTSDSVINFEVWIPSVDKWNHDLEGIGNCGYNGAI